MAGNDKGRASRTGFIKDLERRTREGRPVPGRPPLAAGRDYDATLVAREWRALVRSVDAADGDNDRMTNAAWAKLAELADAPIDGNAGALVKLKAFRQMLLDTRAVEPDALEMKLLDSALSTVKRLAEEEAKRRIAPSPDFVLMRDGVVVATYEAKWT